MYHVYNQCPIDDNIQSISSALERKPPMCTNVLVRPVILVITSSLLLYLVHKYELRS